MVLQSRDPNVKLAAYVSGFTAGITGTILGHPLDTMKVLNQTKSLATLQGIQPTGLSISMLFRGIGPPLLSTGVIQSLRFTLYENMRLSAANYFQVKKSESLLNNAIIFSTAALSGGLLVFLTSPLDNLKVIQQTHHKPVTMQPFYFTKKLLRKGNVFRGISSNLIVGGFGRGFYMAGYTVSLDIEDRINEGLSDTLLGKIIAASVAGISGWFFIFPFDVVRSNMMADYQGSKFKSTFSCFKYLYSTGGVRSFYTGLSFTLIRAVPVAIATLVTYDYTQQFLLQNFRFQRGMLERRKSLLQ